MKEVDLSGSWTLRRVGQKKTTPARIPGCVHTDLLAAGEIEDPSVSYTHLTLPTILRV